MGRRRIHTQGGALDLSVLGQPQTTPMSMLSHPALMSNVGIHNVLQGIHSPLHPNTLRSTGGDLRRDLKHLAYHHLNTGSRGGDLIDDIYHSGRQLLGVGLYAEPHGGDLLDSIYNTGRQLLDSGIDGKPLVDMLLHGGKGLSAEPSGGNVMRGLDKLGGLFLDKAGNQLTDMALGHLFGKGIPAPPSRSPITDPSLIGGRMCGGNELTAGTLFQPQKTGRPSAQDQAKANAIGNAFNAINKNVLFPAGTALMGSDFEKNVAEVGHAFGRGVKAPRKGRFVKGSPEAKAYMASIRKKSGKGKGLSAEPSGGAIDIGSIAETALKFAPLLALL